MSQKKKGQINELQKGPAERGHVKKRQKSSKSVKKFFNTFRQFSRRAKNVKNRQKVSKSFSTLFDNFRAAPFSRPLLQSADQSSRELSQKVRVNAAVFWYFGILCGFWGPVFFLATHICTAEAGRFCKIPRRVCCIRCGLFISEPFAMGPVRSR